MTHLHSVDIDSQSFADWQSESRLIDALTPIFVIGPNKCGTTWMNRSLAAHPHAVGLRQESQLLTMRVPPLAAALEEFRAPSRKAWTEQKWVELTAEDTLFGLRQMIDRVVLRSLKVSGKWRPEQTRAFVEKTPQHARHALTLASLYPKAKFVCCLRDVRDAVVSAHGHMQGIQGSMTASSIESFAFYYLEHIYAPAIVGARSAARQLGPDRYIEVRYEDRKGDDPGELSRVLEFAGLDGAHLQACVDGGSFERYSGGRRPGEEARHFMRKGVAGDWVNYLRPDFAEILLRVTSESLGEWNNPPFATTRRGVCGPTPVVA
ncbi:MAG: sulfotransferase [Phycisphaeraceae bacterium]|nr:sulfotransferase [Phycisphaeraceae bacterium]